jgi:hypothetical protein
MVMAPNIGEDFVVGQTFWNISFSINGFFVPV